jgi:hypothetical protein
MRMQALNNLIVALLCVFSVGEAHAQVPNRYEDRAAEVKVQPWLDGIQLRIRQQPEFKKLVQHVGNRIVHCTFKLGSKGDLADLKIAGGRSDSGTNDQAFLKLIQKAAPFGRPPNDLPYKMRTLISFTHDLDNQYPGNPSVCLVRLGWGPRRFI